MSINKKRRGRNKRGRASRNGSRTWFKIAAAGVATAGTVGTVGFLAMKDASYVQADANGCYPGVQAHTVALIDSSEPRWDAAQTRDLNAVFDNLLSGGMRFNERLSIVTTEEGQIGAVAHPVASLCQPATTPADLARVGAKSATLAFVQKQAAHFRETVIEPVLTAVLDPSPENAARRQERESPILEQIQSVSRMTEFREDVQERHLILVSDLLQSTVEMQACVRQGDLPSFEHFKTTEYFDRIKPNSLRGVRVTVYMLIRSGYGGEYLPFCSEDELTDFYRAYFEDAGASSVEIIRLRMGAHVSSQ
ncbi:hypothetical protein SAMN06297129_3762 [Pseudooceanicola antarcticus]|uniref:Uncharacterized protein n=1 Tax=Pseudooceanicola antarcticus TaxID=1247613 RepID=A0A285JHZ9_9RHOB|nr:hypothetical protein [Pseudooceanicola antarcticus]SNY59437.1 hypothetical protein SAMN06297129_3762 [Pseudooceanicola antarcticus]